MPIPTNEVTTRLNENDFVPFSAAIFNSYIQRRENEQVAAAAVAQPKKQKQIE